MQNAYASYQVTQLVGRCSPVPALFVHVAPGQPAKALFHEPVSDSRLAFQDGSHPGSDAPASPPPTLARPAPPFRYACLPEPAVGRHPFAVAATNLRNRPRVAS